MRGSWAFVGRDSNSCGARRLHACSGGKSGIPAGTRAEGTDMDDRGARTRKRVVVGFAIVEALLLGAALFWALG